MHTVSEMGTSVPAFLGKLWRLVEDPETDDLICWSPNGRSFFIRNQAQFARELLPHYYKHNNMASFVRQLNMYGFHKKVSVELGGLKCDRDEMEFAHQYFCKDHPYLLEHIKRKIASNKTQDPSQAPIKPELMNKMLTEVRSMRGRQEHFDSRLGAMKRENEALWRELALLRQKHHKQQQIVNKLIHFLVSLVQPNRNTGLSMKRRYPLMIDDPSRQRLKQSKMAKSPSGPAIHELDSSDPDLDSDYIVAEMLDGDQAPTIESPEHHSAAEDNASEYYIDEPVQILNEFEQIDHANLSRKRHKGKKKGLRLNLARRKSKVPIKIVIPSTENGEETREETLMLEVPVDEVLTRPGQPQQQRQQQQQQQQQQKQQPAAATSRSSIVSSESKKSIPAQPVPPASVRSSKLAAMAANIKKSQQQQRPLPDDSLDLELEDFPVQESSSRTRPHQQVTKTKPVKLENIMIVPDVNEDFLEEASCQSTGLPSNVSSMSAGSNCSGSPLNNTGSPLNNTGSPLNNTGSPGEPLADVGRGSFGNVDFMAELDGMQDNASFKPQQQQQQQKQQQQQVEGNSRNMSLRCVNPGPMPENNFRLGMMDEVDTHLDSMQSELENLRDVLRSEGYSIDANTLLGLFGADDPMSFGIPLNPDLDPHSTQERDHDDDNHLNVELSNPNNKELMTYNQAPSFLDFDDEMLLAGSSASPASITTDAGMVNISNDPLELADNKGNIFDSLIAANNLNSTQT